MIHASVHGQGSQAGQHGTALWQRRTARLMVDGNQGVKGRARKGDAPVVTLHLVSPDPASGSEVSRKPHNPLLFQTPSYENMRGTL